MYRQGLTRNGARANHHHATRCFSSGQRDLAADALERVSI